MDEWQEEVRETTKAQESRNLNGDLRIVLVGKTGGGRSATGNTILGEKKFESKLSPKPVTQTCRREVREEKWEEKQVVVIDTPAIFDACLPEQQNNDEIRKCLSLCEPGPHALVFVTQAGRFTEEDAMAAKNVEEIFGPEATKYMIVLFTRKEELDGETLEEYIKLSGNRSLQDLVRNCQGRCCAFNNQGTRDEQELEVKQLLVTIDQMMMDNQNKPFLEVDPRGSTRSTAEMKPEEEAMDTDEGGPREFPKGPSASRWGEFTTTSTSQGGPGYPPSLDPPRPTGQPERPPLPIPGGAWAAEGGRSAPRTPSLPAHEAEPLNMSLSHKDSEVRLVLVGKSGGGRSATGNSLLGVKAFESKLSPKAVTQAWGREVRAEKWKGKQVVVIDSPDIFDARLQTQDSILEAGKCLSLCEPGPHALVFVTQAGRFTEEDAMAAKRVEEVFGPEATKYMIVLFTRKEELDVETLEEYIKLSRNRSLQDLVRKCQGRCCAFNNRGTGEERTSQVEELLSLVEKMVQENGEQPYLKPCPMVTSQRSEGRNPGEILKQTAEEETAEEKRDTGEISEGQKKKKKEKEKEKKNSKHLAIETVPILGSLFGSPKKSKEERGDLVLHCKRKPYHQ